MNVDRSHEGCGDCLLLKVEPARCNGHIAGPSPCSLFIDREKGDVKYGKDGWPKKVSEWEKAYIKSKVPLANGYCEMPHYTIFRITDVSTKISLASDHCNKCGFVMRVTVKGKASYKKSLFEWIGFEKPFIPKGITSKFKYRIHQSYGESEWFDASFPFSTSDWSDDEISDALYDYDNTCVKDSQHFRSLEWKREN